MVSCSTDCAGNSCESIYNLAGGCFIPSLSSSSDCSVYSATYGVATEWFKNSTCVLPDAPESQCSMVFFFFNYHLLLNIIIPPSLTPFSPL